MLGWVRSLYYLHSRWPVLPSPLMCRTLTIRVEKPCNFYTKMSITLKVFCVSAQYPVIPLTYDKVYRVKVDADSAMTGATLFMLHSNPNWTIDRNETLFEFDSFDFLVTGHPEKHHDAFRKFAAVSSFTGINAEKLRSPTQALTTLSLKGLLRMEEKIYVMQKQQ